VGAGVQIPANSSRVLDELGVLDEIRKHSVEPIDLLIRSYLGEELYKQNLHPAIQKKFHFPHLLIHRADFRRILFDEARKQGVNVCLGACVESIDFAASKVELVAETSAGAGKSYTADLILGADGEHSICRELLLGRNDPPRSSGDIVFRLAVPAAKLAVHPSTAYLVRPPAVHAWYGQDSHAIGYQLMKDGIFNVVLTIPETKGEATIGPQPADLDAVRAHCVDWDPNFQHLLRSADKALKWTLLQTNEPETWVDKSGRFALLGDSAHASLPYL